MAADGLWGVKAGDKLVISGRVLRAVMCERVTPTLIFAGGRKWRKEDGREIGTSWPEYIEVCDAQVEAALRKQERERMAGGLVKALNDVSFRYLDPDALLAVARAVEPFVPANEHLRDAIAKLEAFDAQP